MDTGLSGFETFRCKHCGMRFPKYFKGSCSLSLSLSLSLSRSPSLFCGRYRSTRSKLAFPNNHSLVGRRQICLPSKSTIPSINLELLSGGPTTTLGGRARESCKAVTGELLYKLSMYTQKPYLNSVRGYRMARSAYLQLSACPW